MSPGLVTLLLFSSLVTGLATGLPLAFVMGGVAGVFVLFLWGSAGLMLLSTSAIGVMDNFIFTAVPLFVLMGMVLQRSGIAEDLYTMIYHWLGNIRGGLAIGTVIICMLFAAMCGISGAAAVAMGVIALPSMLKHNYHKSIVVGSISAGSALGILIPPSVPMIVYGVFAQVSIGSLFAGGILPGLLLGTLFIGYIAVRSHFQQHLGPSVPPEEKAPLIEKFVSLKGVILPILLVMLVLGTIFAGICTPTEAAAIGALGSLLCAAIYRKLNWTVFKESCYHSLRLTCMVMWLVIGGVCFSSLYTALGAVAFIKETLMVLPVSPYLILVATQLILLMLGTLMDPGGIIMICTPVFVPIIKMLGFDPVWFGVIFIVNMEMGYLTPPFGFNLFYMKAIVPEDITMVDIYRSIVPFVALQAVCLVLLVIFPEIVLWLPSLLH